MGTFIASDHEPSTLRIRELLMRDGLNCPTSRVETLESAAGIVTNLRAELIVVVMAPDPERGMVALRRLRARTQGYVLAVGPIDDSMFILRAIREGADEYLNEAELENELEGALMRLASGRSSYKEPGKVIAIIGPNGGCGASTIAVNLAASLAREHDRSALIDMQMISGDLGSLLNLKPIHTLADVCQNAADLDLSAFERSLAVHPCGIHLLAAPQEYADIERVSLQGIRLAINMARDRFTHVVIDLPHNLSHEQADILHLADQVLLVFRLEFNSLRNAFRASEYLEQLGIARHRIKPIINRLGQAKEVPMSKAEAVLGQPAFHVIPDESKTVNAANNDGLPVVLRAPRARVSRSLIALTRKIQGEMTPVITPLPEPSARRPQRAPHSVFAGGGESYPSMPMAVAEEGAAMPSAHSSSMRRWMGGWLPRRHDAA